MSNRRWSVNGQLAMNALIVYQSEPAMRHVGVVVLVQHVRLVRQDGCKIDEMSNASKRHSKAKSVQSILNHDVSASLWLSDVFPVESSVTQEHNSQSQPGQLRSSNPAGFEETAEAQRLTCEDCDTT